MNSQTDKFQPLPIANELLGDPKSLQKKLADDGFLFFKSIIPKAKLLALRHAFTDILADAGCITAGELTTNAVATVRPFREGDEEYFKVHDRLVKLEEFHALAHDTNLMSLMRTVLGDSAFPHPLSIARLIFPNNAPATTPPHQDFPNNQGSEDLTAAWVPLGDCPNHMGPLKVLKGAHKYGILPMRHHLGPGSRAARIPDALNHLTWHRSPFEAGDVLLFSALTVHAATDNLDASKMRLSVDYRYQTEGSPLTAGCLEPHFERLSWEEIYKDWKSDSLKYYWRSKKYRVVEWDDRMHDLSPEEAAEGMRMALEYAAHRGDIKLNLKR